MQTIAISKSFRGFPDRFTGACLQVKTAFLRKRRPKTFHIVPVEPHTQAMPEQEPATEISSTGLDRWAASAQLKLPILIDRVKLRSDSGLTYRDPQHELNLLQSVLATYSRTRKGVESAELIQLLDRIQYGIQHVAQYALDAGDEIAMRSCVEAVNDIDNRIRLLRSKRVLAA